MLESGSHSDAEKYFRQSNDLAREQGALSWELRAATSLARLYKMQGSPAHGKELLGPLLGTFGEGLKSHEVISAAALLRTLQ